MKLTIEATPIQIKEIVSALYTMSSRKHRLNNEGYLLAMICEEWTETEMNLKEIERQKSIIKDKENE